MSAPEVGDRVRVIAGQWTGWEGVVTGASSPPYVWVDLDSGHEAMPVYPRTVYAREVEKVPTRPDSAPRSDAGTTGAPAEGHAANGAQNGGKR